MLITVQTEDPSSAHSILSLTIWKRIHQKILKPFDYLGWPNLMLNREANSQILLDQDLCP